MYNDGDNEDKKEPEKNNLMTGGKKVILFGIIWAIVLVGLLVLGGKG